MTPSELTLFFKTQQALGFYGNRSGEEAEEAFRRCLEIEDKDGPSHFYLKLCEESKENPPGEPWDGVVHLDRK
jgi:hypothetical protein